MSKNTPHILRLVQYFQEIGEVVFLESQKKDHLASKKSYLAGAPKAWIKARGNKVQVFKDGAIEEVCKNPWEALEEFTNNQKKWLFGYLGYDLKNSIEELNSNNKSISSAPDLFFMVPQVLVEFSGEGEINMLEGSFPSIDDTVQKVEEFTFSEDRYINQNLYLSQIEKAKAQIAEGNYYEVNLSHVLRFNYKGHPLSLYQKMKAKGPVPFGAYICVDEVTICSSSPERFLARQGNRVWSQPIKGTTQNNRYENKEVQERLLKSEKNLAENLMIVDLVRNDLSKVARQGSVKVKDLFEVQSFETVNQMVSTVECEVAEKLNPIEIIKACFPMGSMTGAPKIAAMDAIEELEDYKRGIYSGAIGYITPNQDFDFNVVIRTAIIEKETMVYPVGGAITSDSDPVEEWEETLVKAKALLNTQE